MHLHHHTFVWNCPMLELMHTELGAAASASHLSETQSTEFLIACRDTMVTGER